MAQQNRNMDDPAVIERIRRGPHVYEPTAGKHGAYRELTPQERAAAANQQYPKVMLRAPAPNRKNFKTDEEYQAVLKDHDDASTRSIVHNREEEEAWLKANPNPVTEITSSQYPKTMDKTPSPRATDFETLDDFREAKKLWEGQVRASIVHDKEEEELWKREHSKGNKKTA